MNTKITIKYDKKEYEIEEKVEEQVVAPKNDANGTKIIVKDYKSGCWNHTVNINGQEEIPVRWGVMKYVAWYGVLPTAIIIFLIICLINFYKKPEDKEIVNKLKEKVIKNKK